MEENGIAPTPSCDMGANPGNDAASPDAKEKGGIACGREEKEALPCEPSVGRYSDGTDAIAVGSGWRG